MFAGGLALSIAENQSAGFALAEGVGYLVAAFPDGLPRWARYSQVADAGAGARVPNGPRGIVFVTMAEPNALGSYVGTGAPPTLPAICGFVGAQERCCVLAAFHIDDNPQFARGAAHGKGVVFRRQHTPFATTTALPGAGPLNFTLPTSNILIPNNVAWLDIEIQTQVDYTGTVPTQVFVYAGRTAPATNDPLTYFQHVAYPSVATNQALFLSGRLPFPASQMRVGGSRTIIVSVASVGIAQFEVIGDLRITGWGLH